MTIHETLESYSSAAAILPFTRRKQSYLAHPRTSSRILVICSLIEETRHPTPSTADTEELA